MCVSDNGHFRPIKRTTLACLPAVLVSRTTMQFLNSKELRRCAEISKLWREWADDDRLWRPLVSAWYQDEVARLIEWERTRYYWSAKYMMPAHNVHSLGEINNFFGSQLPSFKEAFFWLRPQPKLSWRGLNIMYWRENSLRELCGRWEGVASARLLSARARAARVC